MLVHATSPGTLTALGDDVLSGAKRSLVLLNQIETTISSLCYDQRYYGALLGIAKDAATRIREAKPVKALDPDGSIEEKLLSAQAAAHKLYETLTKQRQSAISDRRLTDEDGVVDEYARTIQVVAELHNAINELRWAAGEHDADLSPRGSDKILRSSEEIEKYLLDI